MRVIHDTQTITEQGVMATIGFFDGVHLGHRFPVSYTHLTLPTKF